jgi:hypothetical protein
MMNPLRWILASAPRPTGDGAILGTATDVEIQASAGADGEAPKRATFKINAYTGGPLRVPGYPLPVVVDLAGVKAAGDVIPILRSHDLDRVVGQGKATINASGIQVEGEITGDDGDAKQVVTHARNGFRWKASIGAKPTVRAQFIPDGIKATANGREFTGPIFIARQTMLHEVSFVSIGADSNATAAVAASHSTDPSQGADEMKFDDWLTAKGYDPQNIADGLKTALKAAFDTETGAPPVKASGTDGAALLGDWTQQIRAAAVAEEKRLLAIRAAASTYGVSEIEIEENGVKSKVGLVAHAIEAGWSAEQTELAALRAGRAKAPAGHVKVDTGSPQVIEASLCLAHGFSEEEVGKSINASDRERVMNTATSRDYRGFGLHRLMDTVIHAAGKSFHGDRKSDDYIRAAFEADRMIRASSGFSTVSLSGTLGNVANKALLAGYNSANVVAPQIARETDAADFKAFSSYRLTGLGEMKLLPPDGEINHIQLQEEDYTNQLKTRAAMLALTRVMMINDDLGSFTGANRLMGRMAPIAREKAVFTEILANTGSFFHADNGNLLTGAGSALAIAGLGDANESFMNLTDANGDPVLLRPAIMLLPPALDTLGRQLSRDTTLALTTTAGVPLPQSNPFAGLFRPVTSPYLGTAAGLTGSSDTAWYLLADPSESAIVEIAYLRGRRTPTVESAETDFNTLGMQWRIYWDFGIALQDTRAGVKNAGA